MNITCTYEHLKDNLRKVDGIVGKNISLPILENILIEAKEGLLFFSATNLEIGVITQVPAKIQEEGSIVIPPQLLQGFLSAISGDEHVNLYTENTALHLESGSFKTVINGFEAKNYPIIPQVDDNSFFTVILSELQKMIKSVMQFATNNDIRPELTGVALQKKDGMLITASTDSFRLGENKQQFDRVISGKGSFLVEDSIILPQKVCSYLNKIVLAGDDEIRCAVKDGHFFIEYDNTHITARLIDGVYPDYTQIIPQTTKTNIILKKKDFLEAMRVMLIFASTEAQEVSFEVSQNNISITTNNSERGRGDAKITASVDGEDQVVTLNPRYVLEGLQNIDQEDIFIGINNETSPVVLHGSDKDGIYKEYTYIVMPVKSVRN